MNNLCLVEDIPCNHVQSNSSPDITDLSLVDRSLIYSRSAHVGGATIARELLLDFAVNDYRDNTMKGVSLDITAKDGF